MRAVLEAFEIGFQFHRGPRRKAVNHPGTVSCAFHDAMLAEISEVLGNFRLRDIENFLKMADAKRTMCQQVDDPQPRRIAETLVNPNQFHDGNMAFSIIFVNRYIHYCEYISVVWGRRTAPAEPGIECPHIMPVQIL